MQEITRELITQAAGGDTDAFEDIYRKASGYVHTIALRITNNTEDAEDVTQEVFVSLHKSLWKFRFKSSFKTWIYRVTVNRAITLYNKRKKKQTGTVPFEEHMERSDGPYEEISELENKEREELVAQMLEVLPPEQRACVVLKEIEGLKYEEIAKTLKIKINTVRSRLKRARGKLITIYKYKEVR